MSTIPHSVDRVRIRPGSDVRAPARARRLVRIAHERLGGALERALAGIEEDVVVERLTVTFPVDPDELDDEAVALLWASLVRESLERARRPAGAGLTNDVGHADATAVVVTSDASGPTEEVVIVEASEALLAWVRDDTAPPERLLQALRRRADLLGHALDGLAEPWRTVARDRLLRTDVPATTPAPKPAAGQPTTAVTASDATAAAVDNTAAGPMPPTSAAVRSARIRGPARVVRDGGRTAQHSALPGVILTPVSRWGGLVLLHYRLRGLLEDSVAAEPDADEVTVRAATLALVTGDEWAGDDPLVRLLAGDPDWSDPAEQTPHVWCDPAAAGERAEAVLRAFAGDLPGFEASTATFVRSRWLWRGALLVEDQATVLLTLERRPLDLMLERLPYPIGALRLPWTPPLFVGWERR